MRIKVLGHRVLIRPKPVEECEKLKAEIEVLKSALEEERFK